GYVAWTESVFGPAARSPAGAAGMWQFMPHNARRFQLRVDAAIDERLDPEKSTRAAARYLAMLLAEFGADSFMLALASYNSGKTRRPPHHERLEHLREADRDPAAQECEGDPDRAPRPDRDQRLRTVSQRELRHIQLLDDRQRHRKRGRRPVRGHLRRLHPGAG